MKKLRTALGAKLKSARQEANLKQEQVARYLRVPGSAISAMESGNRKIDATELFHLSQLYGKPLDWFFDEDTPVTQASASRWHDHDPLVREIILLLEKAPPESRRRAAYGVMGFLSDR
jgi:transcriptional regulator with XRE-family HTH domain